MPGQPDMLVYDFDQPLRLTRDQIRLLLGGKAAFLAEMALDLQLPVPPCFTVTTQACKQYFEHGWPSELDAELRAAMRHIESRVGRRFGDPADPLLVSVRSGAPTSMPGMMDTILDLGLNDATTAGLAAASGDSQFADDCRSRFETMYRATVGTRQIPTDAWHQLRAAIEAVFRSWNGERAITYRRREGIPNDLGTGVTVQAMVFGNRGADSGTGVMFTRDPATGEPVLYGDVLFNAQGEDVVAGTRQTLPVAALDERMPDVAAELRRCASLLEHRLVDMCDIEFTIETGRLWLLQVRAGKRSPLAALRIAVDMAEDPESGLTRAEAVLCVAPYLANPPVVSVVESPKSPPIAVGLAASPGVVCGEIATTVDAAESASAAGRPVILCRSETSPEDVRGMACAAGILTSTGGLASHAAVVARGWAIPAVVGAANVDVTDRGLEINGRRFPVGTMITVDGGTGRVFEGLIEASIEPVPALATLRQWVAELSIRIVDDPQPVEDRAPSATNVISADDVVRALVIKGQAGPVMLAPALGSTVDSIAPLVAALDAAGLAVRTGDEVRLTEQGRAHAAELLARDRQALGHKVAAAALDEFIALDLRMKAAVTAWQLKSEQPEPVFNDHADAQYDARVLADLAALDSDAQGWIEGLGRHLPRLERYAIRLSSALTNTLAGDQRYVASPRVDSYHGIWFELHEDLITLAGRTRAAEVAAGRA